MHFGKSDITAALWAAANTALAFVAPLHGDTSSFLMLLLGVLPALLVWFAEPIAAMLPFTSAWPRASDATRPQPPLAIRALGFIALALVTALLLHALAR
jgi:hypothetical protein